MDKGPERKEKRPAKREKPAERSETAKRMTPVGAALTEALASMMAALGPEEGSALLLAIAERLEGKLAGPGGMKPDLANRACCDLLRQVLEEMECRGHAARVGVEAPLPPKGQLLN